MIRALWRPAARLLAFWSLALALQWLQGAYSTDRADNFDDPAHIVTGLMAREYLVSGAPRPPLEFGRDYYLHYPKVAFGHWPPVFYAEQAAWTLLFPATRGSLLVMLALQLAVLASLLWVVVRNCFEAVPAWCAAVVLETLPGMLEATVDVLTEVAVAVLILLAVLAWVRFLNTGTARSAAAFGLCSAAAILTKATAIVLAPLPLVTVLLLGRLDLLRRARFWLPAAIVAVLCIPWHLLAPGGMHQRAVLYGAPAILTRRIDVPWRIWADAMGRPVALLAAVGLAVLLLRLFRERRPDALMASAATAVIAGTLGRWSFRVWDTRHLTETAPLFVLLAASGVAWILAWPLWQRRGALAGRSAVVLASTLIVAGNLSLLRARQPVGYRRLAAAIVANAAGPASAILVAGDPGAEGGLIAEIAQREPRPRRFVIRATKLFVDADWLGKVRRTRAADCGEVYAMLTGLPVDLAVIDMVNRAPYPYQSQLEQALAAHPESWRTLDLSGHHSGLKVFARVDSPQLADSQLAAALRAALTDPTR